MCLGMFSDITHWEYFLTLMRSFLSAGPHELRCARDKSSLPSARTLSLNFFQQKPARPLDKFLTSAHMVFGQFASHDFGRKNETKPRKLGTVFHMCQGLVQCSIVKETDIIYGNI